ncbi:adenosylmethionine--8-amino-7-oxononanoate transaminase [bacterium]|nr:adenosylmethionine--8-amino-7-oxononanoate transaminase [bacterium]
MNSLVNIDRQSIWHPYTQHETALPPIAIKSAKGAVLYGEDGKEYLDLISSWWVNLHGHSHPKLVQAIKDQAEKIQQIMFAGFTHEPAALFAEKLIQVANSNLSDKYFSKVFYTDDGSTSVEAALKIAHQSWKNQGENQRRIFFALDGAYHGDTFGAMSLGQSSGFFDNFKDLAFAVKTVKVPEHWCGKAALAEEEGQILEEFSKQLKLFATETVALIVEPLVLGASGMRCYRPQFLQALCEIARAAGLLVIFDEVMTGFGRTGKMFAYEHLDFVPDLVCLSKGITGGMLPLGATLVGEKLFKSFLGTSFSQALAHGHSYTANPLACAVALRSLELFSEEQSLEKVAQISNWYQAHLAKLAENEQVEKLRTLGTILAFDLKTDGAYGSQTSLDLRKFFLERGLLIRPLGNTIYLLPPYCIKESQLIQAVNGIIQALIY